MIRFFKKKITTDQSRDTGMAMVLLLLIVFAYQKRNGILLAAVVLHVLNMTMPLAYRPVAVIWLGFSELLGSVLSKALLSVVFFVIVTPLGILRRLLGQDPLKITAFKASEESVMVERNHTFAPRDIEKPY